jgi:hypothetical protein
MTDPKDPAARAVRRLRAARDKIEFAARSLGERVEFTRQEVDEILDDLGVTARAVCELAERAQSTEFPIDRE